MRKCSLPYTHTHTHTHTHPSHRTENSVEHFPVRCDGKESDFDFGKLSDVEDLRDHFESKPVIGGESGMSCVHLVMSICGRPVWKSKVIPSCILITSLHSKHHIAELLLRVGLIRAT